MNLSSTRVDVATLQNGTSRVAPEPALHRVELPCLIRGMEIKMIYGPRINDLAQKFGIVCQLDQSWMEHRSDQPWQGENNKRHVAFYRADAGMSAHDVYRKCVVDSMVATEMRRPADTRTVLMFAHLVGADVVPFNIMGLGSRYVTNNVTRHPYLERGEGVWRLKAVPFPERLEESNTIFLTWF